MENGFRHLLFFRERASTVGVIPVVMLPNNPPFAGGANSFSDMLRREHSQTHQTFALLVDMIAFRLRFFVSISVLASSHYDLHQRITIIPITQKETG